MNNVLLDKGIITPSGAISKDKINLVAEWENALTQIAKGTTDPDSFMQGIEVARNKELPQQA